MVIFYIFNFRASEVEAALGGRWAATPGMGGGVQGGQAWVGGAWGGRQHKMRRRRRETRRMQPLAAVGGGVRRGGCGRWTSTTAAATSATQTPPPTLVSLPLRRPAQPEREADQTSRRARRLGAATTHGRARRHGRWPHPPASAPRESFLLVIVFL